MNANFDRRLFLPISLVASLVACGHRSSDYGSVSAADSGPKTFIELPVKLASDSALGLAGHLNFITSYDVKMSNCASKFEGSSHSADEKIKAILGDTGCTVKLNSLVIYYYYEYFPESPGSNIYVNPNFPGHQLVLQNAPSIGDAVDASDSFDFNLSEVDNTGDSTIDIEPPPVPAKVKAEVEVASDEAPDFVFTSTFAGYDAQLRPKFQFKWQCDSVSGSDLNTCGPNKINADSDGPGIEYTLLPGNADVSFESATLNAATWVPVTNYASASFTTDVTAPESFQAGVPMKMIFVMRNPSKSISLYKITVDSVSVSN